MAQDKTDRREFLKLLGASATAAGLSHFCFLNLGLAAGPNAPDAFRCQPPVWPDQCIPPLDPDACSPPDDPDLRCNPPTQPDVCTPTDPDVCAPPASPDECNVPDDTDYNCPTPSGGPDECNPQDPDLCAPPNEVDNACVPGIDADVCLPPYTDDFCVSGPGGSDPDLCNPPYDVDQSCNPPNGPTDVCDSTNPDTCIPPADPDACVPPADPDEPPLAVTLTSFSAQPRRGHVLVAWETVTEIDNLGFNLYRNTTHATTGSLLVFVPSQAPGSTAGARYAYRDGDVSEGFTYYYWLEDVDTSGATTLHGPVSATYVAPTAVKLDHLSAGTAQGRRGVSALLVSAIGGMALTAAGFAGRREANTDEQT